MAMVKCRECGKEISSTATACPHCGRRTKNASLEVEKIALQKRWYVGAGITLAGVLLLVVYLKTFLTLFRIWSFKAMLLPFEGFHVDTVLFTITGAILVICGLVHLKNSFDMAKRLARQDSGSSILKPVAKAQNSASNPAAENVAPVVNPDGSWICSCGRKNAGYVSTCSCGVQKRNLK